MNKSKINSMQRIYISGAMRSGSSLVSGIINGHSKLKIVDNFHLQRFIIGKKEKLNKNIIYFKIKEMKARLGIRYGIQINDKKVIKNLIEKKKVSYKDVYNELILDQLDQNKSLEIIGEDELKNLGSETLYFLVNALNQMDIDLIRNEILSAILPVRV